MLNPTDMVLVFLVTKPLFLLSAFFMMWLRHKRAAEARQEDEEPPRRLPHQREPRGYLES